MANGNLKPQSEFYNDTQTYSGAGGSATNMYVIEDVYDFVAATGASTYYELVSDIDFNDHGVYKNGVNGFLMGNKNNPGSYLFGNGHKIRNLLLKNISDGSGVFYLQTVQDVVFENLILMGVTYAHIFHQTFGTGCSLNNVHIGCYMFDSYTSAICGGFSSTVPLRFSGCSLNVSGRSYDGLLATNSTFEKCHINVDLSVVGGSNINSAITLSDGVSFAESYVTGEFRFLGNLSGDSSAISVVRGGILTYSYFAVSIPVAPSGVASYSGCTGMTVNGVSFIDKDLVFNTEEQPADNFYYLTTEQATDPNYLISIGFPVIPI